MKKTLLVVLSLCAMVLSVSLTEPLATAEAKPVIKYSCSAQIYDALEKDRIDAFTKKTGIQVHVNTCSSATAVNYLMRGFSDVAATARRLYPRHKGYGYWEIPFSRDPLAVIVSTKNPISNLAEDELIEPDRFSTIKQSDTPFSFRSFKKASTRDMSDFVIACTTCGS